MREWLSGRALPCQGKCREFESRLPLHIWHHGQVVRQSSAKASLPSSNLGGASNKNSSCKCKSFFIRRCGGIGRHKGLKIPRGQPRTGSSPVTGTSKMHEYPTYSCIFAYINIRTRSALSVASCPLLSPRSNTSCLARLACGHRTSFAYNNLPATSFFFILIFR